MLLPGHLGEFPIKALIDSCSTHCFISEKVVQHLQLPLLERHGLKVVVANGETVRSRGLCPSVPLKFNKFAFLLRFLCASIRQL